MLAHRLGISWMASLCSLWALDVAATERLEGTIDVNPAIECWYHDAYPELAARFEPAVEIEKSRLYFRCSLYADYYFVDLEAMADGGYRAIGPMAEESCPSVSYYVEAIGLDFSSVRSPERTAEVTNHGECRRRFPGAAFFSGEPNIALGSVTAGAERMAPGFQLVGVKSFLTASGQITVASGSGAGGISPAVLVGLGAAGAGDLAVAAVGGDGNSPSEPVAGPPVAEEPATPTTTAPPTMPIGGDRPTLRACFDTEPASATIEVSESIRLDARCSAGVNLIYSWDLGDGRKNREGAFLIPVYRNAGKFTVRLTVTEPGTSSSLAFGEDTFSREITVLEALQSGPKLRACFTSQILNLGISCDMKFEAFCSDGYIVSYNWILDEANTMGAGPYPAQGASVIHDWTGYPGCNPPFPRTISVKLMVTDRQGNTDSIAQAVQVQLLRAPFTGDAPIPSSFTSNLTASESSSGRIRVNDSFVATTTSEAMASHQFRGRFGENGVEALLATPTPSPGQWRFDFQTAPGFVPGSIDAVRGQVILLDARSVVFRLSGTGGETLAFTFRLEE